MNGGFKDLARRVPGVFILTLSERDKGGRNDRVVDGCVQMSKSKCESQE